MVQDVLNTQLKKNEANYAPLCPLSFLQRSALAHSARPAIIYKSLRRTWAQMDERCQKMASALQRMGIGKGDVVATMLPNIPEMLELHFAVPMAGGVLNTINTRLDAQTIAYIFEHSQTRVVFVDKEYTDVIQAALHLTSHAIRVVAVDDKNIEGTLISELTYEAVLETGLLNDIVPVELDEWDAISLNYTSGTTGRPKGVVYHHRGAYLNALSNAIAIQLGHGSVYLWTLPMFHCNGWCYPWAVAAISGTSVCIRQPRPDWVFEAITDHRVTHMCAAPVVLNMLVNAPEEIKCAYDHTITVATGGAAPAAATIEKMEQLGMRVIHLYGMTETYGPTMVCEVQDDWVEASVDQRAEKIARQGIYTVSMLDQAILDDQGQPVPKDGETMGELCVRGHSLMKGYLNNPEETAQVFKGGWLHTGDMGVWDATGYVQIKDRSKDIIISGGENISSLEIESVLYTHPAVLEAAVVAAPDAHWGEVPCAFITLKDGHNQVTATQIQKYCLQHLARFKAIKKVVFVDEIPKTSTGKIQKNLLRNQAAETQI